MDPTELVDSAVDNLAMLLQKEFGRMKKEQLGKYQPADRYKRPELWYAVARKCMELSADPYDFLRAAFHYCTIPGGPFAHQLATGAAAKWYGHYARIFGSNNTGPFQQEVQFMINNAVAYLTGLIRGTGKSSSDILLDEHALPEYIAPAYIRVLLRPEDLSVLAKYGKKGRLEILSDRRLMAALKALNYNLDWMNM